MVQYVCETCNHTFNQKSHYNTHLNRKIPCKEKKIKCDIENENKKIKTKLKKSIDIIEQLKKENEELKNCKITSETNNTNINIHSDINNININNGVINNNFNVIKIIDHGKEDYSKVDIKKIMLENPILPNLNYISTVIYYVHCNDELPEYQNIYISDMNRNKAMVYHDGKWNSVDKESTMDKLFNNIISLVDNETENISNPKKLTKRLLFLAKPGSIILLHDNLKQTSEALSLFLKESQEKGIIFANKNQINSFLND